MKCQKCGSECPDGNIFCEACGAELDSPVLPDNIDDKGRMKGGKKKAEPKPEKKKKEKRTVSPEQRKMLANRVKAAAICLIIIAAVVLAVYLINFAKANKGFNSAQSIPLGRNVEYAASETGLVFSKEGVNAMIDSMADYDYVCISEDTVKVSGSEQPQWAILLTVAADDTITDVEYYDFRQLKNNWKGRKMPQLLDKDSLEYGMSIRNVNKALGMKPYYIKRSVSNDSLYGYRYFYTDEECSYDRVYNYYVDFSDVELAVRNEITTFFPIHKKIITNPPKNLILKQVS